MCVGIDPGVVLSASWAENQAYEVEADELHVPERISVTSRLRTKLDFWKKVLHASPTMLSITENGYVLPLTSKPSPFSGKYQMSALQDAEFVEECIDELLHSSCIRELDSALLICSPLSVVESNSEKKSVAINLRHLNMFLFK